MPNKTSDVRWSDIESGCTMAAVLDDHGEAFASVQGSVLDQLVERGFSLPRAEQIVGELIAKYRAGKG